MPESVLVDEFLGALERSAGDVGEGESAERHGETVAHIGAAHVDQLERTAAEVADDAVGLVHAGDDAEAGQMRLACAGQDFDRRLQDTLGLRDERLTVVGVAAGRGGDRPDAVHL